MNRETKKAVGAINAWARRNKVPFDTPITLGVSGGADSIAMMIAAAHSRFTDVSVLTVDHGIQAGSELQALKVKEQAESLGLHCIIEKVQNPCQEDSGNMEALAREGRYEIFARYPLVMLAHTSNDQIETMILGFGRGSGMRSIRGMSEFRDGKYARPFLGLTRDDTLAVCRSHGIEVWDDPHNDHREFRRVHVRQVVVPALIEVFGSGILRNFERTSLQLHEDCDALEQWARTSIPEGTTKTFLPDMGDLPVAVKKRILKNWMESWNSTNNPVRAVVIEKVLSLSRSKSLPLCKDVIIVRETGGWRING